jgi:hypothetical protein
MRFFKHRQYRVAEAASASNHAPTLLRKNICSLTRQTGRAAFADRGHARSARGFEIFRAPTF